jgi:hypothetical protein
MVQRTLYSKPPEKLPKLFCIKICFSKRTGASKPVFLEVLCTMILPPVLWMIVVCCLLFDAF